MIALASASHRVSIRRRTDRDRCFGAGAGEQFGPVLQRPGKLMTVPGPGGRRLTAAAATSVDRAASAAAITSTASSSGSRPPSGGHATQRGCPSRSRVWIGRIRPHWPHGSRTGPQTAQYQSSPRRCSVRRCLPHSAHTGAEMSRCASLVQRDQQVPDRARGGRAAVVEHSWPVEQGLGKPAPFGPAAGDAARRPPVTVGGPARARRSSTRSTTTPIGSASTSGASTPGTGQLSVAGDAGPFGPQGADTGVGAAGGALLPGRCRGRDRFDQLVHRAVEDVQQRHQDLQAQPLRALHDQPVDLAGGQADPALRPAARSGRWWRTCRGRPSPGAGATGSRACAPFSCSFRRPTAWSSNAGPSALRSAVFMKSPLTRGCRSAVEVSQRAQRPAG